MKRRTPELTKTLAGISTLDEITHVGASRRSSIGRVRDAAGVVQERTRPPDAVAAATHGVGGNPIVCGGNTISTSNNPNHRFLRRPGLARYVATLLVVIGSVSPFSAQAPAVATVGLTSGWATFGEAVPQGAATTGLQIGNLLTQTDVKNRWPDGSIRFAIVTANVPAAGNFAITSAAPEAGGFMPRLPSASATLILGGVTYTATLPSQPATDIWLSGPLVSEGRSVMAPVTAGGTAHDFLRVNFDTRVYSDGKARVDVSVENILDKPGATTVTYDARIVVNNQVMFTKKAVQHFYLTRWRKVFEIGPAPLAAVTPDLSPFNAAGALPNYLSLVTNLVSTPNGASYDILREGAVTANMPDQRGRPELAPFPDWTARYLVHKNATQRAFVLANGDLSGSWPVHVREAEDSATSGVGTERLISLDQRPTLWFDARAESGGADHLQGTPLPPVENSSTVPGAGQSALVPDNAHQPSIAYVPYLLTGDRYYAEEMAFWANYGMLRTSNSDGIRGAQGILESNEVRGIAWALRNLADAAAYYPDASPVSGYLTKKVLNNLKWLDTYATSQNVATNPNTIMWTGLRPDGAQYIALWEQNDLAYALDRAGKLGFIGGSAHRDAIAKLQLKLFTSDPDYPRAEAAPSLVAVGSTDGGRLTFFPTMAEISSGTAGRTRPFAASYGAEARLSLMIAVESGWAGAQTAYDYLWPFLGVQPTWGRVSDLGERAGWALDFSSRRWSASNGDITAPTVTMSAPATGATTAAAAEIVTVISAAGTLSVSVVFQASTDHAIVASYLLDVFANGSDPNTASPIASSDLGKPLVDVNGDITVDRSAFFNALAPGTYLVTVSAMGPGGLGRSAAVTFSNLVPTATLSAAPVSISAGAAAILTWSTSNAATVSIDQGIGSVAVSGTQSVSPTVTTIYTLTATSSAGSATATASVTVTADTTPPVISAVASSGLTTSDATIGFTTNEPTYHQVEYGPTVAYGTVTTLDAMLMTSHSQTLSGLTAGTLYHYRGRASDAAGNGGMSGDFMFTTSSVPLPTATLTAVPNSIALGAASTLTWSTTGASTVSINQNIGPVASSGTLAVSPIATTTYTLTATNTAGSVTATATVNVNTAGPGAGVSINFVGPGGVLMGAAESAGVMARANWNNATGAASSTPLALKDETGTATGATVTWLANTVWNTSITDAAGNRRMMKGYLDTSSSSATTVTVAGLPAGAYDVYLYADGDNASGTRTGSYRISGAGITTTTVTLTDASNTNFNTTFTQANNSPGNFVKFSINASGFTLTATPLTSSDGGLRAPVNGIQIVPTGTTTPLITWATPASIVSGTALGAAQLNATTTVAGTFVYTPPSGTVLGVGAGQTLAVTFTPTDTATYNVANAVVLITVQAAAVAVPPVVNLTQTAATTAITGAGLVVGTVTGASSATVASGLVISSNPVAGTSVAAGSAVNLVVSTGPPSALAGVSINFVGPGGVLMSAAESAGVMARANWNNATGATGSTPLALKDETGTATGATVTWLANTVWNTPITDAAGNRRAMKGYLDTSSSSATTVTVAGLPAGTYDVYLYADGDNASGTRTGSYRISGAGITTTTVTLTDASNTNFNTTFTQANNSPGNFVKFSINASGFTLTATPLTSSDGGLRAPVNGIQIVPTGTTTPLITWATPASIVSGTALGAAQLNATTTVAGTFVYTPPSGTVLGVGAGQTLAVTFTPTDTASYNVANAVVLITVQAAAVAVPPVVNLTQAAAASAITGAGLIVGTVTSASSATVASGSVISSNPVAGTQVAPNSAVDLVVSTGPAPVSVPNVVSQTQAAATTAITGAGLIVGTVTSASSATVASGSVISSNPVAGTQVAPNSAVDLVVSTGPAPVSVPNVVSQTQAAATTAITGAGLIVGTVTSASSATVASGSVISSNPVAGTSVAAGSAVNLVVSTGPAPVSVPNVVSQTQAAATTAITGASLVVGTVTNASSTTVASGSVISSNPVAGTSVTAGSAVSLVVSTGPPSPPLAGISINFVGKSTVSMGAAESAGVMARANWNNATGAASSTPLALKDETGTATGATVTWLANTVWNTTITDAAGNGRLMRGYLDTSSSSATTVTVAGLPAGAYDVYLYADGDNGNATRTASYRISGAGITTTTVNLTDASNTNFNATFTQANNSPGNFVKFSVNASGFTLTATPVTSSNGLLRAPVNGIQIVPAGQ